MDSLVVHGTKVMNLSGDIEEKIVTKKRFSLAVESLVAKNKGATYIDACVSVLEEKGLDYSAMKRLLTDSLKQKIEEEALSLNLIRGKKGGKLPL